MSLIEEVIDAVSIPVIASCRVGHHIEAKILEKLGVSMIDESNPNEIPYLDKQAFSIPVMCRVGTSEEILTRIKEGATLLRTHFGNIDDVIWLVNETKDKKGDIKICVSLTLSTPSDISLLFQAGCNSILTSSQIFRSPNPPALMDAIVKAARYYNDIEKIFSLSKSVGKILPLHMKPP